MITPGDMSAWLTCFSPDWSSFHPNVAMARSESNDTDVNNLCQMNYFIWSGFGSNSLNQGDLSIIPDYAKLMADPAVHVMLHAS
jgi:hypothetical protein